MLCSQAFCVQFVAGIQLVQTAQTNLFRIYIIFSYLERKESPKHPQFRFYDLSLQIASSHSIHTDICKYDSVDWHERKLSAEMYMDQCWNRIGSRVDKKCKGWKRSWTSMQFVTNCILLIQWILYQWRCWRFSRFRKRRTSNLHCEICRWPCATG